MLSQTNGNTHIILEDLESQLQLQQYGPAYYYHYYYSGRRKKQVKKGNTLILSDPNPCKKCKTPNLYIYVFCSVQGLSKEDCPSKTFFDVAPYSSCTYVVYCPVGTTSPFMIEILEPVFEKYLHVSCSYISWTDLCADCWVCAEDRVEIIEMLLHLYNKQGILKGLRRGRQRFFALVSFFFIESVVSRVLFS